MDQIQQFTTEQINIISPPFEHLMTVLKRIYPNMAKGDGIAETADRAGRAFLFRTEGYLHDPKDVLKHFQDDVATYDEMVTVKDIPFYSLCEHHLADIFGTCTVSYIPNGSVVGLSKINRLVDIFSRRLQVQERLTTDIAKAMFHHIKPQPKGVGVMMKARHMCMEARGVRQQGHHTITTALLGAMLGEPETRAEFLALAR